MSVSIENAPLIELIAELRWESNGERLGSHGPKVIHSSSEVEQFFMKFGAVVHQLGYSEPTRIVPPQIPLLQGQPVLRFNMDRGGSTRSLYQIGPGVFSANAVPPYMSWLEFAPVVRRGVEALLKARPAAEVSQPITGLTLRYLDAFGPLHMQGKDPASFIADTLGVNVALPEALTQHLQQGKKWSSFLQFQLPVGEGVTMGFAIGEGIANDAPAMLMDTSISATGSFAPNADDLMLTFDQAHSIISKTFKDLMRPISHLMPAKEGA